METTETKIKKEDLCLVCSHEKEVLTSSGEILKAPKGYNIGAIVHTRLWENPEKLGMEGECVYVNWKSREVIFPKGDIPLITIIFKSVPMKVLAYIKGTAITWVNF